MIRRREVLALLGGAAVVGPPTAWGQSRARIIRLAYLGALSPTTLDPRQLEQLKAGFAENGLVEGQNIVVEYYWAEGSQERLVQLASELGQGDFALLLTAGPQATRALVATGTQKPIVFAILNDPIADGFVQSLARPGGNVTGLSMAGADLETKRLEILKDAAPNTSKIMVLHDPSMGDHGIAAVYAAARSLGLQAIIARSGNPAEFRRAFDDATKQGCQSVATMASPFLNFHRKALIALADEYRMPSIWESTNYVRDGGFLAYGPSFPDMYRRSAGYVAKILNGRKPADLPVEQPVKFELAINLKTARALGLTVPPTLLARADEVIE